MKNAVLVTVVM